VTSAPKRFAVESVVARAHEAHEFWPTALGATRLVRVIEPVGAALVLGSTTNEEAFALDQADRHGYEVVRRASGGGAVLVAPGAQVWLMVYLSRDDPLVLDDLGRSFLWIGETVREVLARSGLATSLVDRRVTNPPLAREICFAGLGFGEVVLQGRKVLGLAQRRTRDTVVFQVSLLWEDHQPELACLHRPPVDPARVPSVGVAGVFPGDRRALTDRLIEALRQR